MSESNQSNKLMLVDAAHPEETRIAIVENGRIQEIDYEIKSNRNLKGNIYLAKIVRVEPSLQAAFVDFGENTHGFLPFSEIHPSYFRIPISDREEIEAELEKLSAQGPTLDEDEAKSKKASSKNKKSDDPIEDEIIDEKPLTPSTIRERYKIQEVIENRQVLLIQVVKEARGNKGAALTTYVSLAGRYCVLMPNNLRGTGGVSRKIYDNKSRKRLKEIHESLDVPKGMGVILRTAGTKRTKIEIKRDYQFLLKSWEEIRKLTLASTAPAAVYEEANLIKRYIRDVYTKDIDEILVEGKEGYRSAKQFIKKLVPSHASKVKEFKSEFSTLYSEYKIETQLDKMFDTIVPLPSGGYLVIDTAEALVAIDVNSGKATKERSIHETALKTNLEAADEIARQLKLRDLGGLIVIDFIDMEDTRHNAEVERRVRSRMSSDRARVQIGRISSFGLMELSRQRMRPSLVDSHFKKCVHCHGTGVVRVKASSARMVLRMLGEMTIPKKVDEIIVTCNPEVAINILNTKRIFITNLEQKHKVVIVIQPNETFVIGQHAIDLKSDGKKIVEGSVIYKERRDELEKSSKADKFRPGKSGRKNRPQRQKQPNKKKWEDSKQDQKNVSQGEASDPQNQPQEKPQQQGNRNKRRNPRRKPQKQEGSDTVKAQDSQGQTQASKPATQANKAPSQANNTAPPAKNMSQAPRQDHASKPNKTPVKKEGSKSKEGSDSKKTSAPQKAHSKSKSEASNDSPAKDGPKKKGWWNKLKIGT